MGISVVLRDRTGHDIARLNRPYVPLVEWPDRAAYPILGHVDPHGNTAYNRGQMETLLSELDRLRATLPGPDDDTESMIRGLKGICTDGLKKPHRFLWFIGD